MNGESSLVGDDIVPQIELAQRKTQEARYSIAASAALILFVSGGDGGGVIYILSIIFAGMALVWSSIYYWSSFEIEKGFRLRFIRASVDGAFDGDEMTCEKWDMRWLWWHLDLSDLSNKIALISFASSALLFGVSGAIFSRVAESI